jgi:2-keto-4-pentenoate hydratase/2-oxohepta-3-ene-1,7-dioic acid hydratase in catechol pathway
MKLVRYGEMGAEKPGLIGPNGGLHDLSNAIDDVAGDQLGDAALDRLRGLDVADLPPVAGSPRFGAPVGRVGKFIGVGLNYADHAAETGAAIPEEPVLFTKATSCIGGPNDDVRFPRRAKKGDWEVELALVIGKETRNIKESQSLDHIAGYCICNDISERAFQLEGTGQWLKGKSHDSWGPLGPWLVTRDEIADPQALELWLDLNGERAQTGATATMVFPVVELVSFISRFMTLLPGDVITTGTPPGVGMARDPQRFLQQGDEMRLGVMGLGEQLQNVVIEA